MTNVCQVPRLPPRWAALVCLALLLPILAACRGGDAPGAPPPPVWVEARKVNEGQPVILHAPAGVTPPQVPGLTFTQREVSEDGQVVWAVTGDKGSYVIDIPALKAPDGAEIPASKLFVDIGLEGPTGGPMEDLVALPTPEPARWPWALAAAGGAMGLTAAALWAWRRYRPVPAPPPPEPADIVARRAWAQVRARTDLSPEAIALELSAIYRRYLEDAGGWPATARTTREILDNQTGELTAGELDASRRLLTAMDLVKFAERETHTLLFDALDHDFDRLIRPVRRPAAGPAVSSTTGSKAGTS